MRFRNYLWLALFVFLNMTWCGAPVQAQPSAPSFRYVSTDPAGSCNNGTQNRYNWTNNKEWGCNNGTWTLVNGGTGGTCAGLGGDVTGTCAANTVVKIQNVPVAAPKGTAGQQVAMINVVYAGIGNPVCPAADGSLTTGGCTFGDSNSLTRLLGYHFDGGGSALTGTKVYCTQVLVSGTIFGWHIDADQSGSATFGIRKVAFGSYTGTAGYSGYTDVTGGGTAPILSSAVTATFANLTSWVTAVNAGDEYCFQLSSPATITWVNVVLEFTAN